jgi:hypothetical protein
VILCGALLFFALAWIALFCLDFFYYNRLLYGAVDAIIEREKATDGNAHPINLSRMIKKASPYHKFVIFAFYFLVLIGLGIGIWYTGCKAFGSKDKSEDGKNTIIEYKSQLVLSKKYVEGDGEPSTSAAGQK